jgi:hypothetical protein
VPQEEGYTLTETDARNLAALRQTQLIQQEFAQRIGATQAAEDFGNQGKWLEGFMTRVGATEILSRRQAEASAYSIDTSRVEQDRQS